MFGVLRWRCLLLALCRAARHRGWPRAIGLLAWAVYLGVAPTAISFSTWAYALARSPAGRLGATTYLISALAVAMSWLVLELTGKATAGSALGLMIALQFLPMLLFGMWGGVIADRLDKRRTLIWTQRRCVSPASRWRGESVCHAAEPLPNV